MYSQGTSRGNHKWGSQQIRWQRKRRDCKALRPTDPLSLWPLTPGRGLRSNRWVPVAFPHRFPAQIRAGKNEAALAESCTKPLKQDLPSPELYSTNYPWTCVFISCIYCVKCFEVIYALQRISKTLGWSIATQSVSCCGTMDIFVVF